MVLSGLAPARIACARGRAATSPHAACKMAGAVQGRVKKALTSSSHRSRATPGWGGGHDAVETASAALGLSRVGPPERPAAKRRTQRALGQSSKPSQDARDLNQSFFRMATSRLTYLSNRLELAAVGRLLLVEKLSLAHYPSLTRPPVAVLSNTRRRD
jgi:hypothetical protein